ncbi:uncharacterized protein PFLUO_LOCUS853 [Penicillium psychrofluorescens]|uniref:uncharacterized protein n=1 Tax=Penicillium psychrofluorescens TaxID=3158075 RepID=UPI003CCD59A4
MLVTPRTYVAAQSEPCEGLLPRFYTLAGWRSSPANMLLVHQLGSVRVGEIIRYTVTYTPAADPIQPIPSQLHVRVKNTSAIPLRAAYLHGPYTLYTACYPAAFDPNHKYDRPEIEGSPQFEPYLKAGGNWDAVVKVPPTLQDEPARSVTWMIEIVSQVLFSSSAAVHFELLIGRDKKSLDLFGGPWTGGRGPAAKLHEHWSPETRGQQVRATKGVFSKSVLLRVDDTSSLWNTPPLPSAKEMATGTGPDKHVSDQSLTDTQEPENAGETSQKKKKVHLVVLTHGLHSNLGADMLYLKESIDAATRKVKEEKLRDSVEDENDEEIIVRGFSGNAVRTERGIQYLGKRLAKYVLLMTYPDQPYFPLKTSKSGPFSRPFTSRRKQTEQPLGPHRASEPNDPEYDDHPYQITSISFIGHSLGGLVQTYAIAYIRKHSPEFFECIRPINFIALATPFLGLSNENPMYVRFALDLGLVGRTGQDLGLSWTAPKARSGWGALIGGRGGEPSTDQNHADPGSKPLLRILPCGPAHEVLHKFQHRTIYSNVVNDGIVPLRTSCLLFLDWRGLDRVEKARRGNGLVGTMAEWGWAELTGANSKTPQVARSGGEAGVESEVDVNELSLSPSPNQFLASPELLSANGDAVEGESKENLGPLDSIFSLFRPKETKGPPSSKQTKIYTRSQTLGSIDSGQPPPIVRGSSLYENDGVHTPPRTTFFESAGDLLMPPLPPTEFILDPAARPRTIFHDRIYHPDDIPPPLAVKRRTLSFSPLQNKTKASAVPESTTQLPSGGSANGEHRESGLKVEEKIARAYHRDLPWRKVLVRLEPDAHNNIIVRRMFTNSYGWPVVKHLVDTHFGHAPVAELDDVLKQNMERAKSPNIGPTSSGDEIEGASDSLRSDTPVDKNCRTGQALGLDPHPDFEPSEESAFHGRSETFPFDESHETASDYGVSHPPEVWRQDSARWTDREVDEDDCESGFEETAFRWS